MEIKTQTIMLVVWVAFENSRTLSRVKRETPKGTRPGDWCDEGECRE
jgi:hypothetical protein